MGAPRDIIYPFGIPVDNVFFSKENKAALLQEMGLEPGVPTILFMAGSFGVSGIMDIYREIAAQDIVFQIIVITGKNQKLYEAFAVELAKSKRRTKLIYFTDEVEKYMHAADLLVTKPGGLTVSEALACDIPLAVFDAIPGQEEDNAQFLLSPQYGGAHPGWGELRQDHPHCFGGQPAGWRTCVLRASALTNPNRGKTSSGSSARSQERRKRYENLVAIRLGGRWP